MGGLANKIRSRGGGKMHQEATYFERGKKKKQRPSKGACGRIYKGDSHVCALPKIYVKQAKRA